MAVTKKVVKKAAEPEKKAVVKKAVAPAKKAEPEKKAVVKKPAKKEEPKKVAKVAPKKEAPKKAEKSGKMYLTKSKTSSTNFALVEGRQATQDQFIDILYKKMVAIGFDQLTKEQVKKVQKLCSETLKEVTDKCSFQDTTAGIYYARREIDARVTNPPKAADGLQTLMLKHYELKVRKVLADEEEIKFSGTISDDDANIFITTDGKKIKINSTVATPKKASKVEEEDEDEEVEDEEVEDEDDEEVEDDEEEDEDEDEDLVDEDDE